MISFYLSLLFVIQIAVLKMLISDNLLDRWMVIKIGVSTIFLIIILISCDAPHTNPLDPENPDYNYGRIRGSVMTVSLPPQPVSETTVFWKSGSIQTKTDQVGKFDLLIPSTKEGWLIFSHEDFHSDPVTIEFL